MRLSASSICRIAVAAIVAAPVLTACSTDECYDNRNSIPLAALYTSGPSPQAVSLDSISVWGVGVPRDSMLLDTARNVTQIALPFRIDSETSSFVLRYDAVRRQLPSFPDDTITFSYRSIPVFQSQACGVFYRFDDIDISHTSVMIDSVTCPEGRIDNVPRANINIYFRAIEE